MKRIEKHKIKKDNKYFPFILEQLEQRKQYRYNSNWKQ